MVYDTQQVFLRADGQSSRQEFERAETQVEHPEFWWSSPGETSQEVSHNWGLSWEPNVEGSSSNSSGYYTSGLGRPGTPAISPQSSEIIGSECIREWDRLFQRKEGENNTVNQEARAAQRAMVREAFENDSSPSDQFEGEVQTDSESEASTYYSLDEDETESFHILEESESEA